MAEELWRVYTHTKGDESVTERLVSAKNAKEAEANALSNVKAQNLGKGDTSQEESIANTTVLTVKKAGKNGVLTVNRFPVAAVEAMLKKGKKS